MEQVLGVDITRIFTAAEVIATDGLANLPVLGVKFSDGRTGKKYKFMRATTAWTAGDCIVPDTAGANEPNDGAPCSAVSQVAVGIAVTTVPINGAGWVQTLGEFTLANVTTASVAGDKLGTTATTGRLGSITSAGPSNAEVIAAIAAATGAGFEALDNAAANVCQVLIHGKQ